MANIVKMTGEEMDENICIYIYVCIHIGVTMTSHDIISIQKKENEMYNAANQP